MDHQKVALGGDQAILLNPPGNRIPSGKLIWLAAGISPFENRKYIDSIRIHVPASHVRLPECTSMFFAITFAEPE